MNLAGEDRSTAVAPVIASDHRSASGDLGMQNQGTAVPRVADVPLSHRRLADLRVRDSQAAKPVRQGPPITPERRAFEPEPLMTSAEVAAVFRVCRRTVKRWADAGRLRALRTPTGHRALAAADHAEWKRNQTCSVRVR